ncbi:hypothetical protein BASA81_006224 [Batrachochytrium salamandrivorans]|nr:hypothetical protein BASA81_006224 [Batrachochytrium salamandrivorans]
MSDATATSFGESLAVLGVILVVTLILFFQGAPSLRQTLQRQTVATTARTAPFSPPTLTQTATGALPNPQTAVLVVDDDPVTRLQLGTRLKRRGFTVTEVCDGKEAVELYAKGYRFCLVVMDYEMPELNGVETITQIRRRDQNAIVIGSTIHDATQKQQKFLKAGANKVARTKPIMDDEIDELVREYELI